MFWGESEIETLEDEVKRTRLARLLVFGMLAALLPIGALPVGATTSELFFSEYIEGSSLNKALEIYNGTGSAIDLTAGDYRIEIYFNGSASPGTMIDLAGTVADGDVFVVADDGAAQAILDQADQTSTSNFFNGDDGVVLRKAGVVVDSFGQLSIDPGSQWPGGGENDTLRRNASVCAGDTDFSDAFDASAEWDSFAQDTLDGLGAHTANCNGEPGVVAPLINEFVFNHVGADTHAFIEFSGEADTDYSVLSIIEIEGDSATTGPGVIDAVLPVGTTDASGSWVSDEDVENGSVTLLLVAGFSGVSGDDLDVDNNGVLDSTPWTEVLDGVAISDGGSSDHTYAVTLQPGYDGNSFTVGGASRIPNRTETDSQADWMRNDFDLAGITGFFGTPAIGEAYNTPGAVNESILVSMDPLGICGDPATPIHDIQGPGAASADVGNIREIEGIVVGDYQGSSGLRGFHLQEEDDDAAAEGDPLTSEGIFVFDGSSPGVDVAMGDAVRVRGSVAEFNGLTEITSVTEVDICGTGTVTSAVVTLPVSSLDVLETVEGMSVTLLQALVISEYFNFDRFGEIVLTSERHLTPTAEFEPGPAAVLAGQEFLLDRITLDDGRGGQNPDPAIHPNGNVFDLTNRFRGGDTVQNVTGVMDYAFGLYKIQPTQGADYTNANPRTAAPDDVGGSLKVATFNVLNYFTTLDDGVNDICGPAGDQECRGADDASEFTRQRDKIIAALGSIDADVVGLIEIENHPEDVPTADLVAGLNAAVGDGTYDYIVTGAIGTDAIRQAIIYQSAMVTPLGDYAVLDSTVDPGFLDDYNRPVLAQTFVENATGAVLTVAVNHLKSKGSTCEGVSDPDTGDGAGNCNLTRKAAAQALVDWLAGDPTGSGDPDFLIIGDLNSYDKEDPIDVLNTAGFQDLVFQYLGEGAYSYVFDGQTGYLDYQLAGESLQPQVTGATVWHINADEPDLIDYDTSFKQPAQDAIYAPDAYRSSDHDPVVVGLGLTPARELKETARLELSTLLPTGNKQNDQRIEKAIERINQSLSQAWWTGPSTLELKTGDQVFDGEHRAVRELEKLKTVEVQAAVEQLVEADRQLALVQLIATINGGGDPGRIAKAQGNLADAAANVADGDFANAVLDYKKAWTNAVEAG